MLNRYKYSLIQFHNLFTKEVLNIGVVLISDDSYHYHIPKNYNKIKGCLDFTETSGLKYSLDVIIDRLENQNRLTIGSLSNSLNITDPKTYKSKSQAEEALVEVVDKYMMINKFKKFDNNIHKDKYDKLSILDSVLSVAKTKGMIHFKKHHKYSVAQKVIDMALINKDNMPYSIANLASIYKDDFDDTFIKSRYTLEEALRSDVVKDGFLYVPVYKDVTLNPQKTKLMSWAKEEAKYINVDFLTDPREDAVLERLNSFKIPEEEQFVFNE